MTQRSEVKAENTIVRPSGFTQPSNSMDVPRPGIAKQKRKKRIMIWPGTEVQEDTVILELTSPELEQAANDAESKAKAEESELTTLRATLQRELLDQESITARVHSEYEQAKMERQTNDQLA